MPAFHPLWVAAALATLCTTAAAAAPAPPASRTEATARTRLEALKKRLPALVDAWKKKRWYDSETVKVRLVRLTGTNEAKITLLSEAIDPRTGRSDPNQDKALTIHLRYYDGAWTSTRFEATWPASNDWSNKAARFLMLAIDEASEK